MVDFAEPKEFAMGKVEQRNERDKATRPAKTAERLRPDREAEPAPGAREEETTAQPTSTPPEYDTWRTGP